MTTVGSVFDDLNPDSTRVTLKDEAAVQQEAKTILGGIEWKATSSSLIPEIAKLLDVPLPTVLERFWQKTDEVTAAIEKSKKSPGDPIEVSLHDWKTEASFDPHIEIRLNGIAPGKMIPVKVVLPITFKAAVLKIMNGAIVRTVGGICEIGGHITFGSLTIAELREPFPVNLTPAFLTKEPS